MTQVTPTFARFFRWWIGELSWFVPRPVRRVFAGRAPSLLVTAREQKATIWRLGEGCSRPVGQFRFGEEASQTDGLQNGLGRGPAWVGLSPEQVLRKDVVVPLAAKKNLRSVLGFQIGKQTPFAPEEIYFDYRIAAEDRAEKKLRVTLSLVPRADVDELTKELGKISMPVAGFVATTGKRKVIGRLDFSRKKAEGKGRSITPEAVLCVTAAILLLATAVIPIVEQQRQLNRLLTEVAAARSVARVTSDLRDEMSALMEARDYAAVQKMTAIPVTQAVRDLTRGIPDDTWLTQLNSNGDEIRIAGFTPSAPELVATLEQDPAFRDAALVSKVTRDEEIDLDSFQMRLSIRRLSDQ